MRRDAATLPLPELDPRGARIADLEREVVALKAQIAELLVAGHAA